MINSLPHSDVRFIPRPEKEIVRDLKGEMLKVRREPLKFSGRCNDTTEHNNERASGDRLTGHHTVTTIRGLNYLKRPMNPVRTTSRADLFGRFVCIRHTRVSVANNLRH
jgi:hypothetical protein